MIGGPGLDRAQIAHIPHYTSGMSEGREPIAAPALCVLAHDPAWPPSDELLNALARRGLRVTLCPDPHEAMLGLCGHERDETGVLILLIVEPEQTDWTADLLAAAEVYAPSARLWMFAEEDESQLRQITEDDRRFFVGADPGPDAADGPELVVVPRSPGQGPSLRLTDTGDHPEPVGPEDVSTGPAAGETAEGDEDESPRDPASLLSDDELNMLLADEDPEWDR